MMLYHYINGKYGLENVLKRRVRISRLNELNDPFEFFAPDLSDRNFRTVFRETKNELNKSAGIICLSKTWQNPVMWSHYSDKHKGVCLGFAVSGRKTMKIDYQSERLKLTIEDFKNERRDAREAAMRQCLSTKFQHWSYESEQRLFVNLDPREKDSDGNYFYNFDTDFKLQSIIVGSESKITRSEVQKAVRSAIYDHEIASFKARPAFKSFDMVRNRNTALWQ